MTFSEAAISEPHLTSSLLLRQDPLLTELSHPQCFARAAPLLRRHVGHLAVLHNECRVLGSLLRHLGMKFSIFGRGRVAHFLDHRIPLLIRHLAPGFVHQLLELVVPFLVAWLLWGDLWGVEHFDAFLGEPYKGVL